jgi:hypothetical protein
MIELSVRAATLVEELARDHGVPRLEFNEDGVIPMTIAGLQIAIAYNPANDCFFLLTLLVEAPDWKKLSPLAMLERSGEMASRRTRLAVEPEAKGLALVREIALEGLAYWRLMAMLDEFLADHAKISAEIGSTEETGGSLGVFSDPFLLRV